MGRLVIIWAVIYIIIYNVYRSRLGEILSQKTATAVDLGSLYGKLRYYYEYHKLILLFSLCKKKRFIILILTLRNCYEINSKLILLS